MAIETLLVAENEFYPRIAEIIVISAGFSVAIFSTYLFNKVIYYSSKNVFGVLTRHFNAVFRASLIVGISEAFYFVVRFASLFSPNFSQLRPIFDLTAMVLMALSLLLSLPLLKTMQTIPRVYEVEQIGS